jgi:hypothetical protein
MRKCYQRYKDLFNEDEFQVTTLRSVHNTKKRNSRTARENRAILDFWDKREEVIEAIKESIKGISLRTYKVPKAPAKSRQKKNMTLELLFSDVHYGKLIDSIEGNYVDLNVIKQRVKKVSESVVKEIRREGKSFNVEKVIIALLGDLIENADFHGQESERACEFSTPRQVYEAIQSIFEDLIVPIAMTGVVVHIPCVTGNHDRVNPNKTYVKPGEGNHTFTIYRSLELLSKLSGLKNVTFDIVPGLYTHTEVYGNVIVYEHGDELRSINRDSMVSQLNKRQNQIGKVVHFFRVGHWHEPVSYGQGRMMVNGSVPGQDSFAESKGFLSEPVQILNYYVETKKRNTCFFRSFPIYLQKTESK